MGIVLLIVGICLFIIMGSQVIGRGSRMTIARAMAGLRATSAGAAALTEVSVAQKNRERLVTKLQDTVATIKPGLTIDAVLKLVAHPDDDGGEDLQSRAVLSAPGVDRIDLDAVTAGDMKGAYVRSDFSRFDGKDCVTVDFGVGSNVESFPATETKAALGATGTDSQVVISDAKVRLVSLSCGEYASVGTLSPSPRLRARFSITASITSGNATVRREFIEDRMFKLVRNNPPPPPDLPPPDFKPWELVPDRDPEFRQSTEPH